STISCAPPPRDRSPASSATRSGRWSPPTTGAIRARASSMPPRPWASTAPRSSCWSGTTTRSATSKACSSSPRWWPAGCEGDTTVSAIRRYAVVTGAYWAFTLTDGAVRMLVLLHFHALGYSPFELASLFLLYEIFGVLTILIGGWIGSRTAPKALRFAGLVLPVR